VTGGGNNAKLMEFTSFMVNLELFYSYLCYFWYASASASALARRSNRRSKWQHSSKKGKNFLMRIMAKNAKLFLKHRLQTKEEKNFVLSGETDHLARTISATCKFTDMRI